MKRVGFGRCWDWGVPYLWREGLQFRPVLAPLSGSISSIRKQCGKERKHEETNTLGSCGGEA